MTLPVHQTVQFKYSVSKRIHDLHKETGLSSVNGIQGMRCIVQNKRLSGVPAGS